MTQTQFNQLMDGWMAAQGREVGVQFPVLSKGSTGSAVKAVQILLNGRGHGCGSADGSFGPATDKAVRAYQKASGLTVDGSCGPATWRSLLGM